MYDITYMSLSFMYLSLYTCHSSYSSSKVVFGRYICLRNDILESCWSTGTRVSYKLGAWPIMPSVPPIHAIVNIQRKNLSKTIATNFQSSMTYENG